MSALRAMPIAARVVGNGRVGAVLAARDVAAECCGAAALDCRHHLQLIEADMAGIGFCAMPGHCRGRYPQPLAPGATRAPRRQSGGRISLSFTAMCSSGLITCWIVLVATRV